MIPIEAGEIQQSAISLSLSYEVSETLCPSVFNQNICSPSETVTKLGKLKEPSRVLLHYLLPFAITADRFSQLKLQQVSS